MSNLRKNPIIGIIGGAGPGATINIQIRLLNVMKAELHPLKDQDYYGVIVDNDPQLPNRSTAIFLRDKNIIKLYIDRAKKLKTMGADVLIIACNTSHAFFNDIQESVSIKLLNIINETAKFFVNTYPNIKQVGLLATLGTIKTKIYQKTFAQYGIKVILCDHDMQIRIHQAIYGVKAGYIDELDIVELQHKNNLYHIYKDFNTNLDQDEVIAPQKLIIQALDNIKTKNITHTILGCTDLPLAIDQNIYQEQTLVDPNTIIAYSLVRYCQKITMS